MSDLIDHLAEFYDIAGRPIPKEVGTPPELIARLRGATESNLKLARTHRPGVVSADVFFVRATERADTASAYLDDRPEAWRPYVRGQFARTDVACVHEELLEPSALDRFAPALAQLLSGAERQPARA